MEEEAAEASQGALPAHNVSPSMFLSSGLELEKLQCVVSFLLLILLLISFSGEVFDYRYPRPKVI